jgi:peroxin-14
VEKRIAFLQSKNLTPEEVNIALARAGAPVGVPPPPPLAAVPAGYGYGTAPPPGYGAYPGGYWQQPPPELPRRDWRDWFIMATVMSGVGFGLYVTAKRYIVPLIKPPTPEQLTQDKASIDESFTKAFSTLETLETETKALKEAEDARTTRLDAALTELESALTSLKETDRKRDSSVKRNADELRSLRELIPKAIEAHKTATEQRVKDLAQEVRGLKTLISNRMGTGTAVTQIAANHKPNGSASGINAPSPVTTPGAEVPSHVLEKPAPVDLPPSPAETNGVAKPVTTPTVPLSQQGGYASRFGTGKAVIPAWQMAAAKKASVENLKDGSATQSAPHTPTVTEETVVGT